MIDFDEKYDLVCFDLDDTLVTAFTTDLLPGVTYCWDNWNFTGQTAIVSNQGGVGLRHDMITKKWGEPSKFPTAEQAQDRLFYVADRLDMNYAMCCFAYYFEKKDRWADTPDDALTDLRWRHDWRKPAPGMILSAIELAETTPDRTLMIGDRDEDKEAAAAAGVEFMHRDVFFAQSN